MDLLKNRKTLAVGAAAAGGGALALALIVWPALVSPEPPLEKAGDGGLRIRLVEPPKAMMQASGPLDVGLSQATSAMAKGRQVLSERRPPPAHRAQDAPAPIVRIADEVSPPPEPADDSWRDEATRRDRLEEARRRRWEEEASAREARDDREAWEREARARRRWEDQRERDRYEDRYAPPEDEPRPERW